MTKGARHACGVPLAMLTLAVVRGRLPCAAAALRKVILDYTKTGRELEGVLGQASHICTACWMPLNRRLCL